MIKTSVFHCKGTKFCVNKDVEKSAFCFGYILDILIDFFFHFHSDSVLTGEINLNILWCSSLEKSALQISF